MRVLLAAALLAAAPALAQERLLDPEAPDSARATAIQVLRHLAEGEIGEAAALSNAPRRRFEVLRDYRDAVGAEEFKRVFASYLAAGDRPIAEVALGRHRLLVWKLAEPASQVAGQYYVEIEGKFLLDDIPSAERTQLRRVLQKIRNSGSGS